MSRQLLKPLTGNLLGNADCVNNNNNNIALTLQFSLTALLNLQLLALKRPASSSSNLNRRHTNLTIATSPAKQIKTNENRKKSTHRQEFNSSSSLKLQKISSNNNNVQLVRDNIEELIYISKVKHTYVQAYTVSYPNLKKYLSNSSQQGRIKVLFYQARNNRNNLNIIVTNLTSREFSRAYNISKFYKGKNIQLLQPVFKLQRYDYYNLQDTNVANVFNTVISKLDKVPTQELSSHIKTELLRNNSRKFYHLIITSKNIHYKQTIKKAYIILLERASLILFIT
ncbi:hypothetical protein HBI81_187910 [Parastagonospora nodorum]|nr:hypothetical protein HBI81_187910 [Parastagonospora nodorum]